MATNVKAIPDGYHTVTPYIVINGVAKLIEFVKSSFGATEVMRHTRPDGSVMHAEVRIGDSVIMMGEAPAGGKHFPAMLHLYVDDVDATYQRALEAGATSLREPTDQIYGDRSGGVQDEFGNQWWLAKHLEDVSEEEMARRMAATK